MNLSLLFQSAFKPLKPFLVTIAVLPATLVHAEQQASVSPFIGNEQISELAEDPYWLKLGHYLPDTLWGYESTVDSEEFFFSDEGKYSPLKELRQTVEQLYHSDSSIAQKARCDFPARYTWLESLKGNKAELSCPEMDEWRQALDPKGMTLVFPTAFMNNPSSMFGHTLIRVDAKDQTRHKELVAFAVNFAAEPEGNDNAALYAMKGIVGSYPGRFSVMPYYRKVREYNDFESRDIWEYPLKLSDDEVERVLLHLWEMQDADFDYFFFDENCSYQLLALLQLARNDLDLISGFDLYAIPSDTVERLVENDLVERPKYREAFGTRLLHQVEFLTEAQYQAALAAKQGELPGSDKFTESEQAAILEFAYEWLNYDLYDLALERDTTAKTLTKLLIARSKLDAPSPFPEVSVPSVSPEQGHPSARTGLGYQYRKDQSDRVTFDWRVAYHDLLDSQAGFIPGAKIAFLDTQLSVDEEGTTRLEHLYAIDTMALAPSNKVFNSWAWNLRTGYDRFPERNKFSGRYFVEGGYGKAWGQADSVHSYLLAGVSASSGPLTDYDATAGGGVELGLVAQLGESHRIGIQGQAQAITGGHEFMSQAKLTWNWSLSRQWALRSSAQYKKWDGDDLVGQMTMYWYY